jgi:hypothetical protein
MNRRQVVVSAITALSAAIPPPGRAANSRADQSPDLIVRGRVLIADYREPPKVGDGINLDVDWSYIIRVERVLEGIERRPQIIVRGISDPPLRRDTDLIFDLVRLPDRTFRIKRVRLIGPAGASH